MSINDKLAIYLITYNRKQKLEETLDSIFSVDSPIKDFDITILDNASTDGSSELIEAYCANHPNIKHIRHNINIGRNANICRAFEMGASSGKEYFWVLCDDDKYDWANWGEVERLVDLHADAICVADYVYKDSKSKSNPAYQIFQLSFVPAGIYKSANITSDILMNMHDGIIMMFQQLCLAIKLINENKKIDVLSKPIVYNGLHFDFKRSDLSFFRGQNKKWITERRKNTNWIIGFASIITLLQNKYLQKECLDISIPYSDIYGNWFYFYDYMFTLLKPNKINYFIEISNKIFFKRKIGFLLYIISLKWLMSIFSIMKSQNKFHMIITLLGFKISLKIKNNNQLTMESLK